MLLFDLTACQPLGNTLVSGGAVYAKIVFFALLEREIKFKCLYDSSLMLDEEISSACTKKKLDLIDCYHVELSQCIKSSGCHIFYSAIPYTYGRLNIKGIRFWGTIHGLRDLEIISDTKMHLYASSFADYIKLVAKETFFYKKYAKKRNYASFKDLFENESFRYICVSEHTKYSVLSHFPHVKEDSIEVLYSPLTLTVDNNNSNDGKFFLLVSGNRWLKNSYRALLAIDSLLSEKRIDKTVVVTGSCPNAIYNKLKNKNKFDFKGYVTNEELHQLMKDAFCLVYPSLNEGFGYPPLEAMSCGTPCVVSAVTSIPEVCGDAALYFNPYDIDEIMVRLFQICNASIRSLIINKGYQRADYVIKKQKRDLRRLVDILLNDNEELSKS